VRLAEGGLADEGIIGRNGRITLGIAGDTMLGRGVAEQLRSAGSGALFAPEVVAAAHEADLFVLNLECCISERGEPWPDPLKPFFFRAPRVAVEALSLLGVDCVTLANNHALDFGSDALLDTIELLRAAGIAVVGAGPNLERARAPAVLEAAGFRLGVVGVADHPSEYAATPGRAGIAYARLDEPLPAWLVKNVAGIDADAVLVTPHWGPNMATRPGRHARAAAARLLEAGATLVAGHSAHVFHGVEGSVLYDLGDFVDDYAIDPVLRNDLGILALVTLDTQAPVRIEAVPLRLDYAHTRLAEGEDAAWIHDRFQRACSELGTVLVERDGRLVVERDSTAAADPPRDQ
jgi:poly-gamma-glutamate capsule biosynthesis protein CapA/YwtB (metallophosphatase superfamily)